MDKNVIDKIKFYFSWQTEDESIPDEVSEKYMHDMGEIIKENGWKNVYPVMKQILREDCKDVNEIINWCNLFWCYAACDNLPIPEPYKLVAYLYFKVDIAEYPDAFTVLDSIALNALNIDLINEPNYAANADPKIVKLISEFKENKIKF